MKKPILYIILFLCGTSGIGQTNDSLWGIWENPEMHDTVRLEALKDMAWGMLYSNPDSMEVLANMELISAREWGYPKWEAQAITIIGGSYWIRGDYVTALRKHNTALKIRQEINDLQGLAASYINIGAIYYSQGDYVRSLEFYQMALNIALDIEQPRTLSNCYNNIALIHNRLDDHEKALDYHEKSVQIKLEQNDLNGLAGSYENIGAIYVKLDSLPQAMDYFMRSYEIRKDANDVSLVANTLHDMAVCYKKMGQIDTAIVYYTNALLLFEQSKTMYSSIQTRTDLGVTFKQRGDFNKALSYCHLSYDLADSIGALDLLKNSCKCLYTIYDTLGQINLAYGYFKEYVAISDTLYNDEQTKQITKQELQFEFDRIMLEDSLLQVEKERDYIAQRQIADAELSKQRTFTYVGLGGIALLLMLAGAIYRSYRTKQKANLIITNQKQTLEIKNQEITDSITYAKRIQEAILPPKRILENALPNSFVLYLPKDIVAGDFYWIEVVNDLVIFAVADCTGHGVPGAMVSVVCHNALNRSVREFGLTNPNEILDKTRELVIETFEQSDKEVKDGMDIGLCAWDRTNQKLEFSGAHNGLYLIRDGELQEIKGDKQPVSVYANKTPFKKHEIALKKGDSLYLYTDGYADQFGGPSGKKFKYKPFKQLLLGICLKPIDMQCKELHSTFSKWQGDLEQIDDVCVIGITI